MRDGVSLMCETDPEEAIKIFRRNVNRMPPASEMEMVYVMKSYKDDIQCVCRNAEICVNGGQSRWRTSIFHRPTIFPSRGLDDGELGIASGKYDERHKNQAHAVSVGHHPMVCRGVVVVVGSPLTWCCCRARHIDGRREIVGVIRGGGSLGR